MASTTPSQDQQHPQERKDREIVNRLLQENPEPYPLAELARLRIRYRTFPGARDIQRDLDLLLEKWQLTEEELFAKTRHMHGNGEVYQRRRAEDLQDWS